MTIPALTALLAPYELPRLARVYVYREPNGLIWYTTHPEVERSPQTECLGRVDTDSRACVVPDIED